MLHPSYGKWHVFILRLWDFFFPIPLKIHSHMTRRSIICNRAAHVSLRPQRRTRNFRNFQQHRRKQLQYILCEQSTKLLITRIADDLFYCKPGKQQNNHVHQLSSIHTRSTFVQQFTISAERYASSCRMNWLIWYQHKGTPSAGSHTKECLRWSIFLWACGGSRQEPSVGWGTELTAQTEHAF